MPSNHCLKPFSCVSTYYKLITLDICRVFELILIWSTPQSGVDSPSIEVVNPLSHNPPRGKFNAHSRNGTVWRHEYPLDLVIVRKREIQSNFEPYFQKEKKMGKVWLWTLITVSAAKLQCSDSSIYTCKGKVYDQCSKLDFFRQVLSKQILKTWNRMPYEITGVSVVCRWHYFWRCQKSAYKMRHNNGVGGAKVWKYFRVFFTRCVRDKAQ